MNRRLRAGGFMLAIAMALASPAGAQPAASGLSLSGAGLDSRLVESASRIKDAEVQSQLGVEKKLLQEGRQLEFTRRSVERRIADRTFLYYLATGAVSSEALGSANLKREELLQAARATDPFSPALTKARATFDANRVLVLGPTLIGRPSVQQVDPDTPAPPGNVPSIGSIVPAKYVPSQNRFDRLVYREGFSEVVALGRRAAGEAVGTIHCSGTLLNDGWLITAAHCLFDKQGARVSADQLLVYMPFQGGSEQARAAQGLNRNLRSSGVVPTSVALFDPAFKPNQLYEFESAKDLALMRMASPPGSAKLRKVALRPSNAALPFTMAGYGLTNAADPARDGSTLEVARRTADVRVFPKYLLYESVDTKGMGRVCSGDSGGPVFAGELNGAPKPDEHELVGVVSGSTATGDSVAFCRAGNQYIIRVNTAEVGKWVCKSTAGTICY